jgi:L-iditol 2-dehydrogenase
LRAAFVPEPGRVEVGDFPVPVAGADGEVVVRMERASICGSDVHAVYHGFHNPEWLGRPGYPGHEGVGEIVDSRSARFPTGVRVLTVPVGSAGGCFAEYQLLDEDHVVPLPADGDPARLLMAQQYGTTLYSMRMFCPGVRTGTAAIMGAGSAGLFFLQQAVQRGFENVVVSDLNAQRLAVAGRLGARTLVHAPGESVVDAVMDVTGGAGADLVIEAAGYDALRADAVAAVALRGTVGFFGFPERRGMAQFPMYEAFRKIVRIQWAGGTQSEPGLVAFRDAVEDIHAGRLDVDHCLGPTHRLDDVPAALEIARDQGHGAVKLTIDVGGHGPVPPSGASG